MFFIFGIRYTFIVLEQMVNACEYCGAENSVYLNIFQRYFHIFWIPVLPLGKIGNTQCHHCKQVLEAKEMSDEYKAAYKDLKSRAKTPIWTFAGLAVIIVLAIVGSVTSGQHREVMQGRILNPQIGDVYEYKLSPGEYTLLKVAGISGDDISLLDNTQVVNKIRGLVQLQDSPYETGSHVITKMQLAEMVENASIIDIDRK